MIHISNKTKLKLTLITIAFLSITGEFLFGLTALAKSFLANELGADDKTLGLITSSYGMVYCFMPLILGKLSDGIGRKKSILFSYVLYFCNSFIYYFANTPYIVVLGGILDGVALSFLWPAITSFFVELAPDGMKERNLDYYMISCSIGAIMGPFIGGFVIQFSGTKTSFVIMAIFSMFSIIAIIFFIKIEKYSDILENKISSKLLQTNNKTIKESIESNNVINNLKFEAFDYGSNKLGLIYGYLMVLLSGIYLIVITGYYSGYADKYTPLSDASIGIIIFFIQIGRAFAFNIMRFLSKAFKINIMIIFTCIAMILVYNVISTINVYLLSVIFLFLGFISGFGFSAGYSVITDIAQEKKGLFIGIAESIVGLAFFVTPYLPFLILGDFDTSPFIFVIISMFILLLAFGIIRIQMKIKNVKK